MSISSTVGISYRYQLNGNKKSSKFSIYTWMFEALALKLGGKKEAREFCRSAALEARAQDVECSKWVQHKVYNKLINPILTTLYTPSLTLHEIGCWNYIQKKGKEAERTVGIPDIMLHALTSRFTSPLYEIRAMYNEVISDPSICTKSLNVANEVRARLIRMLQ